MTETQQHELECRVDQLEVLVGGLLQEICELKHEKQLLKEQREAAAEREKAARANPFADGTITGDQINAQNNRVLQQLQQSHEQNRMRQAAQQAQNAFVANAAGQSFNANGSVNSGNRAVSGEWILTTIGPAVESDNSSGVLRGLKRLFRVSS